MVRPGRTVAALVVLLLLLAGPSLAEESTTGSAVREATGLDRRFKSGYGDLRGFGGPISAEGTLRDADVDRKPLVAIRSLERAFQPWFDWKHRLKDRYGLSFGIDYTVLYQSATASLGEDHAAGGIFQVPIKWDFVGRGTPHPGGIHVLIWHHHKLGTTIPPADLGVEIGSATPTTLGFADYGWGVAELLWQQMFCGGRAGFKIGNVLPIAYIDSYPLINPLTAFLNHSFSMNPTMAFPASGLGVVGMAMLGENLYVETSLSDANGSTTRLGFDTFFNDREFFKHIELGWTPAFEKRDTRNFHIVAWHTDARTEYGSPSGRGLTFSGTWDFESGWSPFLRAGWSTGGAAALRGVVSVGTSWKIPCRGDLLGIGLSYGHPEGADRRDQYTTELFYRLQLTRNVVLTPDVQWIHHPADNPETDDIGVFGMRFRVTF